MAQCLTPYTLKDENIQVPCGRCPHCRARRASGWSFRLMKEGERSSTAHFITLTYETVHVPITDRGFMSLKKRDLQLFFKRLRKLNDAKIKYYACGEYGGKTMRPHYHIILFNCQIDTVQPAWSLGQIHYGSVTGASIGYTLKYISKVARVPLHSNDDRVPEFSLMSKRLGANYLTPSMIKWHHADLTARQYITIEDGKKIALPRYYKDKLYDEDAKQVLQAHAADVALEKVLNPLTYEQTVRKDAAVAAVFEKAKQKQLKTIDKL